MATSITMGIHPFCHGIGGQTFYVVCLSRSAYPGVWPTILLWLGRSIRGDLPCIQLTSTEYEGVIDSADGVINVFGVYAAICYPPTSSFFAADAISG